MKASDDKRDLFTGRARWSWRFTSPGSRHRAFTLIETLMVIAIVGLMAAMSVPAMGRARESAHRINCTNKLRQKTGRSERQSPD